MKLTALLLVCLGLASVARADGEAVLAAPPPDGHRLVVSGAVLTALGGALALGSIAPWMVGGGSEPVTTAYAGLMDGVGAALLVPGVVLLSVGLSRRARHARWRAEGATGTTTGR
jgi:hypothetical protein